MSWKVPNCPTTDPMEIVNLTSDDDSFEGPVFQSSNSSLITNITGNLTKTQYFQQILISSDEETDENLDSASLEKENVPTVDSPPPPKIIGLGPEDAASANFSLQAFAYRPRPVQVYQSPPKSPEKSKPGAKRFFRWGSGEDNEASVSMLKKRPSTGTDSNEAKKRNIEFDDDIGNTVAIGGPSFIPDASNEVDPNCGCTGGDIGVPAPAVLLHHRLEIAGVKVDFPLTPYPAQKAVMNALIKGCRNGEHALVESPTGSGKTLALLCGALAWQVQYNENYTRQMAAYVKQMCQPPSSENLEDKMVKSPDGEPNVDMTATTSPNSKSSPPPTEMPKTTPKIYYGSRTHRQISQVTKELRRTIYKDTKMTILSSRDFTCIQQGHRNKTELCNELLDPLKKTGCTYYNDSNKQGISHYRYLQQMNFSMPFDIEDLVKLGTQRKCCPYFAARNLMAEADLILCPYNYLIDPSIRKAMQINLTGAVVILDEAHNIEDICRESASSSFTIAELDAVLEDCQQFHKHFDKYLPEPEFVEICYFFCTKLKKLIETMPGLKKRHQDRNGPLYSTIWHGAEFRQVLHLHEISATISIRFVNAVNQAIEQQTQVREELAAGAKFGVALSMATIRILEKCQYALENLRSNEHCNDFRVFVKEATEWIPPSRRQEMLSSGAHPETIRTLECLCMNPGIIFSSLAKSARSIILASGTLSPIISFASELGTTFKQVLQNKHVIAKENVHIRIVPEGPQGISLKATYANTSQWNFQDEIGRVILDVCESVPFGVLCFFPSYTLLNTISQRMSGNGIMDKIRKVKVVFTEPRKNNELNEVMRDYRNTIKELTNSPRKGGGTGALLFAVFRGKVAEGIDFSDNEARAVLTIGIPYAIVTEPAVELKMQYNDLNKAKQLMRGGEWYTVQAYRALNQALGRCIRHINDWGAIMLVDERLMNSQSQQYLPKWVKAIWGMGPKHNAKILKSELSKFVRERTEAEELRKIGDS